VLSALTISEVFEDFNSAILETPYYQDSFKNLDSLSDAQNEKVPSTSNEDGIEIKNVTFGFNEKTPILKNVNFNFQQGEKIAFIGKSGSGKTTLVKLILGELSPQQGEILIGGEVADKTDFLATNKIAVLDQKPFLFNRTIEENFQLINPKISKKQINQYLNQVGLTNLIKSLPDGIETSMEEAGTRFSGGEQQRFALARVLAKNSSIIILDEPTVGLDPITEREVINTIFENLNTKTILWITHHRIGLDLSDTVIKIENGKATKTSKY
jgi:ATP-binding cassette subfamily C protein CydC